MDKVNKPTLVIMAAGMGSRFGGLKQIEPISDKGEIILDFSLYDAVRAGFGQAVFVIKEENEADFRALIDHKAGRRINVSYAFQRMDDLPAGYEVPEGRVKPWGTAHAVMTARKSVKGPFAVINADDYYGPTAFRVMHEFLEKACDGKRYDYCMVAYSVENTLTENGYVSRGVCSEGEDGTLCHIQERTKIMRQGEDIVYTEEGEGTTGVIAKGTPVSMNFWGFTPSFMEELERGFPEVLDEALAQNPLKGEYFLPSAVDRLVKGGKATVKMLRSPDKWYGVTYKEDKAGVVSVLQAMKDEGLYPEVLWP